MSTPEAERELRARREHLVERFTMMQADLGGAFYEMAVRDHIRLDVLTRKTAELQRVDAELAAVEQALSGSDGRVVGTCPTCTARHGEHARFCSRCGTVLVAASPGQPAAGQPAVVQPAAGPPINGHGR